MRTISQRRHDVGSNPTPAGRDLGAAELDRVVAAGGPSTTGVGSGGGN
jgi:hypothetical protein